MRPMDAKPHKPHMFKVLKETFLEFLDDNGTKLSASLSYYTIFSIGPLLLLVISLTGLFVDKETIANTVNTQIQDLLGAQAAEQILTIIDNLQNQSAAETFGVIS